MRGAKFFGIFVACVLILLLAVCTSWAKKPDEVGPKPESTIHYGYAELSDGADDEIWSDGEQYIDRNNNGEDEVEITTDETGKLVKVWAGLGSLDYESDRTVRFRFDINSGVRVCEERKAVYDILLDRGVDDGTVHFGVGYWASDGAADYVVFIIDRGWDGSSDPGAITQDAVNSFYTDDTDENYRGTDYGHVSYYLGYPGYPNPPCIEPEPDPDVPNKWTITCSGDVTLYVMRTAGNGHGKKGAYERMDLAEYGELPFSLTVWFNEAPAAPRKHNTLSTLWGEMKTK